MKLLLSQLDSLGETFHLGYIIGTWQIWENATDLNIFFSHMTCGRKIILFQNKVWIDRKNQDNTQFRLLVGSAKASVSGKNLIALYNIKFGN